VLVALALRVEHRPRLAWAGPLSLLSVLCAVLIAPELAAAPAPPPRAEHRAPTGAPPAPGTTDMIYLDHNASTPVRPEVAEAMRAALAGLGANPSSMHREGQRVRAAVERAREQVAALAVAGAEKILRREVDAKAHAELLDGIKKQL